MRRLCVPYRDRSEAGRVLAARLAGHASSPTLVLALPRGGVPVAFEVARALGADLDLMVVRKLGFPRPEEIAAGAGPLFEEPGALAIVARRAGACFHTSLPGTASPRTPKAA